MADNVAFSQPSAAPPTRRAQRPLVSRPPRSPPRSPRLSRRRRHRRHPSRRRRRRSRLRAAPAPIAEPAAATHVVTPLPTDRRSLAAAGEEPRYRLFEGTLIETVLTNRLDGTFTGPVNCLVSVPVYASDQQHLVIPAGSRVLGEARAVNTFGQSRLAVVFHRVILPNGTHVDLNGFHGLNQVGDLGLQDQVDRHYAQIFGVSLAIGAIAGLCAGAECRRPRRDRARCVPPRRRRERLAVQRADSRSVPQHPPDRHDSGGPPHQGLSLE